MEASERELIETTVADALDAAPTDADPVLAEIGWLDMLASEPGVAIAIVCERVGAAGAASTVLDDVVATAAGVEPRSSRAVVLPRFGDVEAAARRGVVDGLASARIVAADSVAVIGADDGQMSIAEVPVADLRVGASRGLAPSPGLHAVHGSIDPSRFRPVRGETWADVVAFAQRAVSHEMLGACRTMLTLARDHAMAREQFGQPIVGFQAVRHRLAEALVAVESLAAVLVTAADEPGPLTAALAKATANRTGRTVARHCQQVLAGIGFTTEHPFHRYLKRTMVLDGVFGSLDTLTLLLGRHLITTGTVPTLVEL